jgi:WD40 repeat protein
MSWGRPHNRQYGMEEIVPLLLAAIALSGATLARAQSPPPTALPPPITIVSPAATAAGVGAVLQRDPLADEILAVNALSNDGQLAVVVGVKIGAAKGDIVVWDTTHNWIVNRLHLPGTKARFSQVQFDPGGTSIIVEASVAPDDGGACKLLRYHVDLLTAEVGVETIAASQPNLAGSQDLEQIVHQVFHPAAQDLADDAICNGDWGARALPRHKNPLGLSLRQAKGRALSNQLQLINLRGEVLTELAVPPQPGFDRATISPDAHRIAVLNPNEDWSTNQGDIGGPRRTVIRTFDLVSRQWFPSATLAGVHDTIQWLDADHYAAIEATDWGMPDDLALSPAHVIDATTGHDVGPPIAARCFMKPLAAGFVGAGLANCTTHGPKTARGIEIYRPRSGWRGLAIPALERSVISDLAVSPDGRAMAVALSPRDLASGSAGRVPAGGGIKVIDLASNRVLASALEGEVLGYAHVSYAADGRILIDRAEQGNGARWLWNPAAGAPQPVPADDLEQDRMVQYDPSRAVGNEVLRTHNGAGFSGQITRVDMKTGKQKLSLSFDGMATSDLSADGHFLAVETAHNGIQFWNTRSWTLIMTLHFFANDRYFFVTPGGRYDTNLDADTPALRWLASDQRLRSLAPQSFIRQYFEPGLGARLLDCYTAHACGTAFKPVTDILSLNRVLPKVRDLAVYEGPTPDTVRVEIAVEPGFDPAAANGKTQSGLYNLRLFRNNALVAHWTNLVGYKTPSDGHDIVEWRHDNRLAVWPDGAFHATRIVRLPTDQALRSDQDKTRYNVFSAYAFNEDRVKGDTVRIMRPIIPARAPPHRRAFVLSIGINRYDAPRLQLQYAASDATLMAARLGGKPDHDARTPMATRPDSIPGYDMRTLTLAGTEQRITKAVINAALQLLSASSDPGSARAYALAKLREIGIDGSAFEAATPDDLVIISYSGHGWTDRDGNFFMLPADARWTYAGPPADRRSMISAGELASWLEDIDAGDMALVIDACHSAASVAVDGFKPGPMGDAGLGQLAYDKGIHIIAASQSDDVALEDASLQHGLLTYALAVKGIDEHGFGEADLDDDKRIKLNEWLRYAVNQLPSLSKIIRLRRAASGFGGKRRATVISDSQAAEPKPQVPALFDFNAADNAIVLREAKAP